MDLRQTYEDVPYPDLCYAQTHPSRLATLSALLGMQPAPVERCRVLELGCARGGNLIPLAEVFSESSFVGVDFSPSQVQAGQEAIDALGLDNIELHATDVREFTAPPASFDYIIAHGFYSWVSPEVRDHALSLCRVLLAPQGVAYIGYNTYPGWHMMGSIRDMMQYKTRHVAATQDRGIAARDFVQFIADWSPSNPTPGGSFSQSWSQMLKQYVEFSANNRDPDGPDPVIHDELEVFNSPVYFHQFVDHATKHGLQYVTESDFPSVIPSNIHPNLLSEVTEHVSDLIELEQIMDFLRNRSHRQTLLCHQEVSLNRSLNLDLNQLGPYRVRSRARPQGEFDCTDYTPAVFAGGKVSFSVDHPATKCALKQLIQCTPESVPFHTLAQTVLSELGVDGPESDQWRREHGLLAFHIMRAFTTSLDVVDLRTNRDHFVREISTKPMASDLARYQAQRGQWVTNRLHERVRLDPLSQRLLTLLNGNRSGREIIDELASLVPSDESLEERTQEVILRLEWMACSALLIG